MDFKLPISKIIISAVYLAWYNKEKYIKAIALPTFFLVLVWAASMALTKNSNESVAWLLMLLYGVGFALFAVTCHRLILLPDNNEPRPKTIFSLREFIFFGWVLMVYSIVKIIEFIPVFFVINIGDPALTWEGNEQFYWVNLFLSIPSLYVLSRLCLVFPAAAIGKRASLKLSWRRTKNNGWRIFSVVVLAPWLFSMFIWFIWREDATVFERVILTLISYAALAIEIFALSLTYKEIESNYEWKGE